MRFAWLALFLLACEPMPDGSQLQDTTGTWFVVRPPPGAPEGTQCWHFYFPNGDASTGGPVCLFPPAETH